MLPERELRRKLVEITKDPEITQIVLDINSLRIQGAKNVALASLKATKLFYEREGVNQRFYDLIDLLQNLRYTQVITYNVLDIVKIKVDQDPLIFDKLEDYLKISYQLVNQNFLKALECVGKNQIKILTHCHSSEEVSSLIYARNNGYGLVVYVTETRPKYQGIKTAKELSEAGIEVIYIVDSAAGLYMEDVDLVLFGCDAFRENGLVNKIGTYLISLCAKKHEKPVWFVGDVLKTDLRKKFEIEMRDPREIIDLEELKGVKVLNPAFDITPWELVDLVITDKSSFKDFEKIREAFEQIEF
jgi:translation initiation factor 2B subunit (eIF-2B alpha/beta/delta family)